jgi:hypothetical protein
LIPNEIRLKRFFYKKLMDSILFLKKNKSSHCAALGPPNIANARVVTGGGVFWDATGRKRSRKADASASIVFRSTSGYFFARFFFGKKFDAPKKNGEIGPPNAASPGLRRHNSRPAISF